MYTSIKSDCEENWCVGEKDWPKQTMSLSKMCQEFLAEEKSPPKTAAAAVKAHLLKLTDAELVPWPQSIAQLQNVFVNL